MGELRRRPNRSRKRATRLASPICARASASKGEFACVRKDRLTARNGSTYLSLELRDRTGTLPARVFREADRIGLRFESGDAVRGQGADRALPRRPGRRAGRRRADRAGLVRPRRFPARRLPLGRGARGLPRAPRLGEIHHDGLRSVAAGARPRRAARVRVSPGAVHAVGPPRLPRRPARAHGRGRDAGPRDVPAPSPPQPGPAPRRRAGSRRRQGARVHLRRRVRRSPRRGGCSATSSSAPRWSAQRRRGSTPSSGWRSSTASSATTARPTRHEAASASRRPRRLALYRVNALDAGVKGALESGLGRSGSRSPRRGPFVARGRMRASLPRQ